MIAFLYSTLGEVRPTISQILEATIIYHLTEPLHLALGSLGTTCFFIHRENFIKVTTTKPRQTILTIKKGDEFPRFFLEVSFRVPIKSSVPPREAILRFSDYGIDMEIRVVFDF